MRIPIACVALLVAALHASVAFGQTGAPEPRTSLDLATLLTEALERNPSLRAARLEAEALATRPAQASALPDPTIVAGYRPLAVEDASGVVPSQLMVQQMIPYPGKRHLAGRAATLGAEAASYAADAATLDLAAEIQEVYYELYRIQHHLELIEDFEERLRDYEEAAAVRYEVGQGPQQAILKAQVERLTLSRLRLELEAAWRTQLERLARLTNRPDLYENRNDLVLERPEVDRTLDTAISEALNNRPEIAALRALRGQADTEIALAERAYLPDFMVGVGFMDMMRMNEPVQPLDALGDRFSVQVGVTVPLQRASRRAAVEEAQLRKEQLDARLEALETTIQTEINDLYARLQEEREALTLYEEALIPQAETTLASTLSAYTAGQTTFLDLLDAERMLFDLHMGYEETLARFAQTRAALERALGLFPRFVSISEHTTPEIQP